MSIGRRMKTYQTSVMEDFWNFVWRYKLFIIFTLCFLLILRIEWRVLEKSETFQSKKGSSENINQKNPAEVKEETLSGVKKESMDLAHGKGNPVNVDRNDDGDNLDDGDDDGSTTKITPTASPSVKKKATTPTVLTVTTRKTAEQKSKTNESSSAVKTSKPKILMKTEVPVHSKTTENPKAPEAKKEIKKTEEIPMEAVTSTQKKEEQQVLLVHSGKNSGATVFADFLMLSRDFVLFHEPSEENLTRLFMCDTSALLKENQKGTYKGKPEDCTSSKVKIAIMSKTNFEKLRNYLHSHQNAKIIHLVRDPRSLELPHDAPTIRESCHNVMDIMKLGLVYSSSRYIRIQFEDFIGGESDVMSRIFKFLSLPYSGEVELGIRSKATKFRDSTGRTVQELREPWKQRGNEITIKTVLDICQELIKLLG